MAEQKKLKLADAGAVKYYSKHGIKRAYPTNGVPETSQDVPLSEKEKEMLKKPLLQLAKEPPHALFLIYRSLWEEK
jgi:hypothetical protein